MQRVTYYYGPIDIYTYCYIYFGELLNRTN